MKIVQTGLFYLIQPEVSFKNQKIQLRTTGGYKAKKALPVILQVPIPVPKN